MDNEINRLKKRSNTIPVKRADSLPGETEADNFEIAAESFMRYCRSMNLAESTIKYYTVGLNQIRKLLEYTDITRTDEITEKCVREYVIYRIECGVSAATVNQYLRGWRPFGKYLEDRGIIANNPFKTIKNLRYERKLIETLSEQQIHDLMDSINKGTFTGLRDLVILLLMLENGARLSEALGIKLIDIVWAEGMIKVYGKGRKERLVPFQIELEKYLREYIHVRGKLDHDYLFVSIQNLPLKNRSFQDNLRDYGRRARIRNVRVSPHTLRYTFVKLYITGGGDGFSLKRILGHTSMEQVNHYVNMFNVDVLKQHQKFSPLSRILKR